MSAAERGHDEMAAQYLSTSRLSNLISMISLGQQSGILRVVRGEGATQEVGQIRFVAGTPAAATLGSLTGAGALNVLMNWGECLYSFDEIGGGDSRVTNSTPSGAAPSSGAFGSVPESPPPLSWGRSFPASPLPSDSASSTVGGSGPGYIPQSPPPLSGYPASQPSYGSSATPGARGAISLTSVFRRIVLAERVEQLPLDRRERMILLLVDGRRSVAEISRITRRDEQEICAVLDHLTGLGLIQATS